jgi:hypothetical protein
MYVNIPMNRWQVHPLRAFLTCRKRMVTLRVPKHVSRFGFKSVFLRVQTRVFFFFSLGLYLVIMPLLLNFLSTIKHESLLQVRTYERMYMLD